MLLLLSATCGCRARGCGGGPPHAGGGVEAAPISKDPRDGRVLYDFLQQRASALVYEDGALVIDPVTPELYKFIDGGFRANLLTGEREWEQGRPVALADGVVAVLRFPGSGVLGGHPLYMNLWLRPAQDAPQRAMSLLINERIAANLELTPGWRRYRVPLPAGRVALNAGENMLRLHFRAAGTIGQHKSAAAIARITVGPALPGVSLSGVAGEPGDAPLPPAGRTCSYGIGPDARQALCASTTTRWSYHLVPPGEISEPVHLAFGYGTKTEGRPVRFTARVARDGEGEHAVFSGQSDPGRWQEADVDLSPFIGAQSAGRALRVDLAISPLDGEAGPAAGAISWPRLFIPDPPAGAPTPPTPPPVAPPRAEHLIFFVVDAMRADRLPAAANPALPALSQLVDKGVRLGAVAQGNYGLPAHASLLSGTYPQAHHLVREASTLADGLTLLPEVLQRAGFATGLFSASGYVSDRWGLHRGFDAYRNLVREGVANSSQELWKTARPWLESQVHAGRRVFLYLATADPHAPYVAQATPGAAARGYTGPLRGTVTAEQLLQIKRGQLKLNQQDRAYLESVYDGEVAATDATLGALLAELTRLGIADKTAIVLVSSHGEELLDHGSVGHGHSLYQELISVPLLFSFPARLTAGRAAPLAELVDVAPTALHLLGAAVPESMRGESLLPYLEPRSEGRVRPRMPRLGYSQHDTQLRSAQLGRYKLIAASGDHLQLYDLAKDPHEQHDLAGESPLALRAMRDALGLFMGQRRGR